VDISNPAATLVPTQTIERGTTHSTNARAADQPAGRSADRPTRAVPVATARWFAARRPWRGILTTIALLCMGLVFFESVADILPDGTIFWLVTPSRALIGLGLLCGVLVAPAPSMWRTWLDIPMGVLVVASLVASFGNGESMSSWRWVLTGVSFYYLVVIVRRMHPDTHRAAMVLGLLAVAVCALTALRQAANETPTGFCRAPLSGMSYSCEQPGALVRVIGTFSNPNLLAAFLLLCLPLAWLAVDEWLNRTVRITGYLVVALGYLALVDTWSRAAIAAAVLGALTVVVLRRPTGRRLRIGSVLIGVGFLAAVVVVLVAGVGNRAQVWTEAVGLAVRHPLGVGVGRAGALLDEAIPGDMQFQHAHNTWLNWLVEAGWLGFLAVVAVTLLTAWRIWRSALGGSRVAAAAGAGLFGFAVMSLADHPANAFRIALGFYFVLGLVMTSSLPVTRPGQVIPGLLPREETPPAHDPEAARPVPIGPESVGPGPAGPVPAVPRPARPVDVEPARPVGVEPARPVGVEPARPVPADPHPARPAPSGVRPAHGMWQPSPGDQPPARRRL